MLFAVRPNVSIRRSAWPDWTVSASDSATRHSRRSSRLTRKSLVATCALAEFGEPLRDPRPELVRAGKGRAVRFGARKYFVGRGTGLDPRVEVDQGGRTRAGATRHEGRPGQLVERGDLPSGEVHVEHAGRIGDDVGGLGNRGLDAGVRHPSVHRRELLAA